MDAVWRDVTTIAVAIIGIAILAVLVSRNANTSGVIQAATGGFAQDLSAATAPVTGGSSMSNFGTLGFTGGLAPID
jgi:hypothetical protein